MARYDAYDPFARIYDRHWGGFAEGIYPILDHLVLRKLPHGCAVMDLCCGTGQLARRLSNEGYDTTGVDGSQQMIAIARENAPNAEFLVEDARDISVDRTFSAVFSTYDSLNHVMELDELEQVFRRVYSMLWKMAATSHSISTWKRAICCAGVARSLWLRTIMRAWCELRGITLKGRGEWTSRALS